jgi:hypothetical protein
MEMNPRNAQNGPILSTPPALWDPSSSTSFNIGLSLRARDTKTPVRQASWLDWLPVETHRQTASRSEELSMVNDATNHVEDNT